MTVCSRLPRHGTEGSEPRLLLAGEPTFRARPSTNWAWAVILSCQPSPPAPLLFLSAYLVNADLVGLAC